MLNLPVSRARFWLLLTIALSLSALMSACGFHLRGVVEFPFKTIYVTGSETTPFGFAMRRNLKNQQTIQLVFDARDAEVILDILSERPEKVILSLSVQGMVREYTLNSYLTFQVRTNQGQVLLPPTTIVLHRSISYNDNIVLSKTTEEEMLYKDMQNDLVQQVTRRLAALDVASRLD